LVLDLASGSGGATLLHKESVGIFPDYVASWEDAMRAACKVAALLLLGRGMPIARPAARRTRRPRRGALRDARFAESEFNHFACAT